METRVTSAYPKTPGSRMSFESVALNIRKVARGFGAGNQVVLIRQVRRAKRGKEALFLKKKKVEHRNIWKMNLVSITVSQSDIFC